MADIYLHPINTFEDSFTKKPPIPTQSKMLLIRKHAIILSSSRNNKCTQLNCDIVRYTKFLRY